MAEAKTAVEDIMAGKPVTITQSFTQSSTEIASAGASIPLGQMAQVLALTQSGKKIDAIKLYRQITGAGLKDAKDAVEAMENTGQAGTPVIQPEPKKARSSPCGCLFGLMLVLIFIGGMLLAVYVSLPQNLQNSISDFAGRYTGRFGYVDLRMQKEGSGPGMFSEARVIAADSGGNIYLGDWTGGRIQAFDGEGHFLGALHVDGVAYQMSFDGQNRLVFTVSDHVIRYVIGK